MMRTALFGILRGVEW